MTAKAMKKTLTMMLSFVLFAASSQSLCGYQTAEPPSSETSGGTQAAPMSPEQLNALVAPVALYPDASVAQILAAATFPDQVAIADYWLQQNKDLTGSALTKAVDKQSWDASVKALTAFRSVLDNMAKNLTWTSSLGEAYHNQPSDVMKAVQTLRAQAKKNGNLKSNAQITVVQQSPQTIVIQPTNPQVVYVPEYNPAVIYGTPYVTPRYTAGDVAAGIIGFGAGIAVGALMSGGGWSSWGCNWHGGAVVYNQNNFYGNAAWHGGYGAYGYHGYGGYGAAAYHGPYGSAGAYHGYGAYGGYHTGAAYENAWGSGTTHTGYGPDGAVHTGGSGYNAATGQGYHYGASSTPNGGTAYHGTTSTGQHYAGGTTASGEHWGGSTSGSGHDDGWSSRAASERGWGSMRSSGFGGGRFGGGGFGGGRFGGGFRR